jgi:hypothetical protein
MKKENQFQARQGDVFVEKVESIPAGAIAKKDNIVAVGESQNHAHAMFGKHEILEKDGEIYISVKEEAELKHILLERGVSTDKWTNEHHSVKLSPGNYKVTLQQQFDPYAKKIVQVRD